MHTDADERTAPAGADRLAAWRDATAHALAAAVQVRARHENDFAGTLDVRHLGYVRVLSPAAEPVRLSRTPRLVARDRADGILVALQEDGTAALTQDGRSASLLPGDLAVIDLRRPFSLEQRHRFRQRLFRLPGHVLNVPSARLASVTGRALPTDGGAAAPSAAFLARLADRAARIAPPVGDVLAGVVADLVVGLVDAYAEEPADRPGTARDHLLPAVYRYIDRHLPDPDLTPETVARAHRISVRYLHRLFEDEESTVGGHIRRRRVEESGKDLTRPAPGRDRPTIATVALRWGFPSPAHFSRAFRAAYGVSPREWRGVGSGFAMLRP
ncbi:MULTISPECIES: helix-turn-helix domain-containing protein [Streptomyces]|uniref:helix-turn-helix domain-containing protein n=1 Tax=Streptomyces TaxID=1883 RepID=UPI00163C7315|nr:MULTISPECIES: helix-turn-helix domain-containing protein [Streptomyces]MBC2875564.1 helix-turn-helix domain-containing protein [Streptomyces sp. TYQ1024]UBI35798.1 helix-turn-helix domain-containing protein [Streptomyces mobaraensis]UKW28392.1 helix-turn-helix domain-containing protein [Streptomyces sp. TYQ1024]